MTGFTTDEGSTTDQGPAVEVVPIVISTPFNAEVLFTFLSRWAVPGVEVVDSPHGQPRYARALRLPHGPGLVRLTWTGRDLIAELRIDPADREAALVKIAALCDTTAPADLIDQHLGADPHLRSLVASGPGLRIPGTTDRHELAFQVLISQQISMAAAVICAAKITRRYGEELTRPDFGLSRLFPTAAALAMVDPVELPMPRARGRAMVSLARALTSGEVDLSDDVPLPQARSALLAQPGIGPWTADSIAMRGLGDRDILLDTDLVIRRELAARGVNDSAAWSPFRSYATIHLWRAYV